MLPKKSDVFKLFNSFNKKSKIVKLKISEFRTYKYKDEIALHLVFNVLFDLQDKTGFVDTTYYDKGNAYLYLSDKFYDFIDVLFSD